MTAGPGEGGNLDRHHGNTLRSFEGAARASSRHRLHGYIAMPAAPWPRLVHDDGTFRSPYEVFRQPGSDQSTDRRLFFVSASSQRRAPSLLPDTFITNPRTLAHQDKKTYSVSELDGRLVSGDNLFSVYLGESLAPYITLSPLTAALPVSKKAALEMPLDHSACKEAAQQA